MTTGRLTRQELGWLLAQEARGAAKVLRQDVTLLTQPPPPVAEGPAPASPDARVTVTLNALDDAIGMLSELESGAAKAPRRGRIDLAALLVELAPGASLSLEPGAGTEVFGEEAELRRMLHVLVSQTSFATGGHETPAAAIKIRRDSDWVRITADLGPDISASTDLERRWLGRMATRLGGHLELEGGTISVLLPADASNDQSEVADLRKELEQAQQLGEAYARELAAMFAAGPPAEAEPSLDKADVATRRFDLLTTFSGAAHRVLSPVFRALNEDALARASAGAASPNDALVTAGSEFVAELARIATCSSSEPVETVDVSAALREAIEHSEARAARHGVKLVLDAKEGAKLGTRRHALALVLRSLLDHGIAATPRDGTVTVVLRPDAGGGCILTVEDGGPAISPSAHTSLLEHRIDPASMGRPPGIALLVAFTTAAYLRGKMSLGETPSGKAAVETRLPMLR